MTAKKETAAKATKAPEESKPTQKQAEIKVNKAPTSKAVDTLGLYPIKSAHGGLNIKALPLPGNRVLLILPNGSTLIDNLTIVKAGEGYALK